MYAVRTSGAGLKLFNYEEALKVGPMVDKWVQLAQIAALGSHPHVLEDGPELPKIPGPRADEGGKISDRM
jgi:hypothetical protein